MKKLSQLVSVSVRPLVLAATAALVFASCKKNDVDPIRTPAAGLMAFNLSPDKSSVGFTLSGNQFGNAALGYTNYTGSYLPVFVGAREVRSVDLNSGSTIALTTQTFADSNYYSAFLIGAAGSYRNVVVKDALDSLTAMPGKAWVRYVNAIPDTLSVPVVSIGTMNPNQSAPYATVTQFIPVNAGTVSATISNHTNISVSRDLTLEQNKIYTILFVGRPNQTDTTQGIQIKYIQNGTID